MRRSTRRSARRRSQRGFTLVEVLVSLVLAAIAMIGVIALYRAQTNASSFSRRTTEATTLAEDQVERLRTQSAGYGSSTTTGLNELGKTGGVFDRFQEITSVVTPDGNYDEIRVIVSWTEDGTPKKVTVIGRRNLKQ